MFALLVLCLIFPTAWADFSVKSFTSWFSFTQPTVFVKEYTCCVHDSLTIDACCAVTMKSWSLPKIVVEVTVSDPTITESPIDILANNNKIEVHIPSPAPDIKKKTHTMQCTIIVPHQIDVHLASDQNVKIKNIEGPLTVTSVQGTIEIRGVVNSVHAQAPGTITVQCSYIEPHHHITLISTKNNIHFCLPSTTPATLYAKTMYGSITSVQEIMLDQVQTVLNKNAWEHLKREIRGTTHGGGAHVSLQAYNGIDISC